MAITAAVDVDAKRLDTRKELLKSREGSERLKVEDLKKVGNCPACQDKGRAETTHFYIRKFHLWGGSLEWPSQRLYSCPTFTALTDSEKGQMMQKLKACGRCSS